MNYSIRTCAREDVAVLLDLCEEHALYEKAVFAKEGKQANLTRALFSEKPSLYCMVVEHEGDVVGYASYTFDYSTWEAGYFLYLDCLYLREKYRGYRIGEAIFRELVNIAQQAQCVNIQWQTPVFNDQAIRFYKRMGGAAKDKVRFSLPVAAD